MLGNIDTGVLEGLYHMRSDGLVNLFLFLSTIGETAVMLVVTLMVALLLYFWFGMRKTALGLIATMATSTAITYVLKHVVARARPDILYEAYAETGFSFPSGHSSAAAAFCGFFMYVAWTKMAPGPRRTLLISAAFCYIVLMAFGRLYLGVHYLSDVAVGIVIGVFAAAVGAYTMRIMQKRSWFI